MKNEDKEKVQPQPRRVKSLKVPRRLPNGTRAWTSSHYDKAADAVMDAIGIDVREWSYVRQAIREALETTRP